MKAIFAPTSNVKRLLLGLEIVEKRGAAEAGYLLVTSVPGYGKTETLLWLATQQPNVVYLRAKSGYNPHWLMSDLLSELRRAPERHTEDMFRAALAILKSRPGYKLIIDEAEHAMANKKVVEAIRDLSDLAQIPVILVGMDQIQDRVERYPQVTSRVAAVVHFQPADLSDIQAVASTLLEGVALEEDLAREILRQTHGMMREVLNALARIEAEAKLQKLSSIGLRQMAGKELTHDWKAKRPRLVPVVGGGK